MFSLTQLTEKVFLLQFDNTYDLGMHFLRVQEYYESGSENFRGKIFTILDYMDWYVKNYKQKAFMYPSEWAGYNIPGEVLYDLYRVHRDRISDWNRYDDVMKQIHTLLYLSNGRCNDYYLIGAQYDCEPGTIEHELAHGLWSTNKVYKKVIQKGLINLTTNDKTVAIIGVIEDNLEELGYASNVFDDEIQAYLTTGFVESVSKGINLEELEGIRKPFIEVFNDWTRTIKIPK